MCNTKQATLEVAKGNRETAVKMLEDPDALMANPEIQKIIAEGAQGSEIEVLDRASAEEPVEGGGAGTRTETSTNRNGQGAGNIFSHVL